ncbi:hypothetical protein HDU76_005271 [Blyttiomyces sp. JEL0837]|nr:hypothetical protein HDU76_005271 [Blyttiomyces sp. JEL0837]
MDTLRFVPQHVRDRAAEGKLVDPPAVVFEHGIVAVINMSGYSAIVNELIQDHALLGHDHLRRLLNKPFEAILERVQSRGGSVVKFYGDAVIACWPTKTRDHKSKEYQTNFASAIVCCLELLSTFHNFSMDPAHSDSPHPNQSDFAITSRTSTLRKKSSGSIHPSSPTPTTRLSLVSRIGSIRRRTSGQVYPDGQSNGKLLKIQIGLSSGVIEHVHLGKTIASLSTTPSQSQTAAASTGNLQQQQLNRVDYFICGMALMEAMNVLESTQQGEMGVFKTCWESVPSISELVMSRRTNDGHQIVSEVGLSALSFQSNINDVIVRAEKIGAPVYEEDAVTRVAKLRLPPTDVALKEYKECEAYMDESLRKLIQQGFAGGDIGEHILEESSQVRKVTTVGGLLISKIEVKFASKVKGNEETQWRVYDAIAKIFQDLQCYLLDGTRTIGENSLAEFSSSDTAGLWWKVLNIIEEPEEISDWITKISQPGYNTVTLVAEDFHRSCVSFTEIAQTITRILSKLTSAANIQIMISFDDFQWIDIPSMEIIYNLMKTNAQILCMIASRPIDEYKPQAIPIFEEITALWHVQSNKIELHDLDVAGIEEIIYLKLEESRRSRVRLSENLVSHPYAVSSLVDFLLSEGRIYEVRGKLMLKENETGLDRFLARTVGFSSIIAAQFDKMTHVMKEILSVAAVSGQEFDFQALVAVIPSALPEFTSDTFNERKLVEIIQTHDKYGFLSLDKVTETYHFSHYLVQQTVLSTLIQARITALNELYMRYYQYMFSRDTDTIYLLPLVYHLRQVPGYVQLKLQYFHEAFLRMAEEGEYEDATEFYEMYKELKSMGGPSTRTAAVEEAREFMLLAQLKAFAGDDAGAWETACSAMDILGVPKTPIHPESAKANSITYWGHFLRPILHVRHVINLRESARKTAARKYVLEYFPKAFNVESFGVGMEWPGSDEEWDIIMNQCIQSATNAFYYCNAKADGQVNVVILSLMILLSLSTTEHPLQELSLISLAGISHIYGFHHFSQRLRRLSYDFAQPSTPRSPRDAELTNNFKFMFWINLEEYQEALSLMNFGLVSDSEANRWNLQAVMTRCQLSANLWDCEGLYHEALNALNVCHNSLRLNKSKDMSDIRMLLAAFEAINGNWQFARDLYVEERQGQLWRVDANAGRAQFHVLLATYQLKALVCVFRERVEKDESLFEDLCVSACHELFKAAEVLVPIKGGRRGTGGGGNIGGGEAALLHTLENAGAKLEAKWLRKALKC